jgi:hypothetical protein
MAHPPRKMLNVSIRKESGPVLDWSGLKNIRDSISQINAIAASDPVPEGFARRSLEFRVAGVRSGAWKPSLCRRGKRSQPNLRNFETSSLKVLRVNRPSCSSEVKAIRPGR